MEKSNLFAYLRNKVSTMEMLVNKTHIDPNQSTPLHKNADNASTKENADNSEDNSSIKSRDINSKSKRPTVI